MSLDFGYDNVYFEYMRSTYSPESVLGTRSRILVLRVLHGVSVPLNASQIAARTGLSQPAVSTVLHDFALMGIVESSPAGRAWVHWLVRDNAYVRRMVDPIFDAEETIPDLLLTDLRETFGDLAVSVALFGSYARGDQDESSDIDLVLVGADTEAKAALEEAASVTSSRFAHTYGATLSPLVYDMAAAATLWQRAPSLQAELEREAVVISGLPPSEWRKHGQED
jgi:DNA-binding transcriptional ArsR family regulator